MRPENANYLPGELFYHNHSGRVGIGRIPLGTQACQSLCECPSGSEETRRILCVQHVCVLAVLFVVDVVNTFNQCVIVCQSVSFSLPACAPLCCATQGNNFRSEALFK